MASRKILEISKGPYMAKVYYDKPRYFFGIRLYKGKTPINGGWDYVSYEMTRAEIERKALDKVNWYFQGKA